MGSGKLGRILHWSRDFSRVIYHVTAPGRVCVERQLSGLSFLPEPIDQYESKHEAVWIRLKAKLRRWTFRSNFTNFLLL